MINPMKRDSLLCTLKELGKKYLEKYSVHRMRADAALPQQTIMLMM